MMKLNALARSLRLRFERVYPMPVADCGAWLTDPLAHPTLQRMSLRELADLPSVRHPTDEIKAN